MHYFFAGGAKRCLKYFCLFPPRMIYLAGKRMGEEPMKTMTVSRAAAICGGRLTQYSDAPIGRAIIDSRQVQPGDMDALRRAVKDRFESRGIKIEKLDPRLRDRWTRILRESRINPYGTMEGL